MFFKFPLFFKLRQGAALALGVLLLTGCAVKRDAYNVPKVVLPERFSKAATAAAESGEKLAQPLGETLVEWWALLGSSELNVLVDRVIANNPDLRIATLRIAQLLARSDITGASRLPEINAPLQIKNEGPSVIGSTNPGESVESRRTYQAGIRIDWRPDLWGESASLFEASRLQLLRATFQRDDLQRTVLSNVLATYVEFLTLNDRLRVAKETDTALSEMLGAVATRLEVGDATAIDHEQQKAAVYQVRATVPVLQQQRELVFNRLASLAGAMPGNFQLTDKGLDSLRFPATLPDVPLAWLLRRPDVRAVEAQLLTADVDIDTARARVLPPLDLSAQVGFGSRRFSDWFEPHNLAWNLIANLSANLFDGGKRSKEVAFSRAVHEEMNETYLRVIYEAAREVDTSLSSVKMQEARLKLQGLSADAARQAWLYSQEAYQAGAIDYLVLLDTERTYTRNLDDWMSARQARYQGLTSLFSALGGGIAQVDNNTVAPSPSTEPSMRPSDKGIDWSLSVWNEPGEHWLVEVSGLYEHSMVAPAWRDLQERFPAIKDRVLLPYQVGQFTHGKQQRAAWYRLYVAHNADAQAAQSLCGNLQARQQRCRVMLIKQSAGNGNPGPRREPVFVDVGADSAKPPVHPATQ
jgi:NodT family efflux transporter outer membrane factor (OMF) lipoprotein